MRHFMKQSYYFINLVFCLCLALIGFNSCKSYSKTEKNQQPISRVFDKKPKLDTLLNEFAKPIGYANDYAGLYNSSEIYELDSLLYSFESSYSIQLIVVTFDSIMASPLEIDNATAAIGNGWRVGGDSSKGSVIGISKTYKRMRIQNGKYIQLFLSDSTTKKIVDSSFIPEFKKDHYFEGTKFGIISIIDSLKLSIENKAKVKF